MYVCSPVRLHPRKQRHALTVTLGLSGCGLAPESEDIEGNVLMITRGGGLSGPGDGVRDGVAAADRVREGRETRVTRDQEHACR